MNRQSNPLAVQSKPDETLPWGLLLSAAGLGVFQARRRPPAQHGQRRLGLVPVSPGGAGAWWGAGFRKRSAGVARPPATASCYLKRSCSRPH